MGGLGSGRRKKIRLQAPMSEVKPRCPSWLSRKAKLEWNKIAGILDRIPGHMKECDWTHVALLADSIVGKSGNVHTIATTASPAEPIG